MSDSTVTGIEGVRMATGVWNGTQTTLPVNQAVSLPQTPDGTVILGAINASTMNQEGEIAISSGGGPLQVVTLPAGGGVPWVEVVNLAGNNLQITNISPAANTSVLVEAFGPGIPGAPPPHALQAGTPLSLAPGQTAQGASPHGYALLRIQAYTSSLGVVGIIGGPLDPNGVNGKVIALNFPGGMEKPEGYYAVTNANAYTLSLDYDGSPIFVCNLSFDPGATVSVELEAI